MLKFNLIVGVILSFFLFGYGIQSIPGKPLNSNPIVSLNLRKVIFLDSKDLSFLQYIFPTAMVHVHATFLQYTVVH